MKLSDLTPELYSIPDDTPEQKEWLSKYCPPNLWKLHPDGSEIICEFTNDEGETVTTTRSIEEEDAILPPESGSSAPATDSKGKGQGKKKP